MRGAHLHLPKREDEFDFADLFVKFAGDFDGGQALIRQAKHFVAKRVRCEADHGPATANFAYWHAHRTHCSAAPGIQAGARCRCGLS